MINLYAKNVAFEEEKLQGDYTTRERGVLSEFLSIVLDIRF